MSVKETALSILIKARDLASAPLAKFRGAIKETDASTKDAAKSVDKYGNQLTEADKAAGRFIDKSDRMREANGRFVKGLEKTNKTLKKNKDATHAASGGISSLTTKVIALAGTYLGINALKNAFSGIIGTGAQFELLETQITTLMGSIEAGKEAVQWIKDFTATTPAELTGVAEGFIKLKAFGIDPMNGSYQAIIDQTAKLGFSQEKMEGVILAVGQAWTKQKLQGEEALQLIERGVPVWDLLAKATGKNTVELQKLSSAGKLGRKEIALLIEEMGRASQGAAAAQMKTWNGLFSNLKDYWTNFVGLIADAGVFDFAKAQLEEMLALFGQMAADGRLKEYAQQISDFLVSAATKTKKFLTDSVGSFEALLAGASNILDSLNETLAGTNKIFAAFSIVFNGFTAGIKTVAWTVSSAIAAMLDALSKGLGAVGMEEAAARYRIQAAGMQGVSKAFKEALQQDAADISDAWNTLADDGLKPLKKAVSTAKSEIVSQFDAIANKAKATSEELRNAFVDSINTAKTQEDVEQLKKKFEQLGQDGRVSTDHLVQGLFIAADALDALKNKAEQAKKTVKTMADGLGTETTAVKENTKATTENAKAATENAKGKEKHNTALLAGYSYALKLGEKTKAQWDDLGSAMSEQWSRIGEGYDKVMDKFHFGTLLYLQTLKQAIGYELHEGKKVMESYNQQAAAAERMAKVLEQGGQQAAALARHGEKSLSAFTLLDKTRLDSLRTAMDAINRESQQLTDNLSSTVASLRDELAALKGDNASIEVNQFERQLSELRTAQKAARDSGNADAMKEANQAIQLLKEAHQLRLKNIEQEKAQAQAQPQYNQEPTAPASQAPAAVAEGKTMTVHFKSDNGQSISGQFFESDAEVLVRQLSDAASISR
ncbi:tape measure protein [uncultured Amphritea sp.]|uniref:tape measure protein n=1 Tax=uncultured Amphritea sp. TaxID=981605 RepID=UPI00262070D0|nr:tape measure protein [uncultured Amphritea sp.]